MKKFMKSLMLVAVAAMSFASCSNNFEDVNNSTETFSLTIESEKPALESDSRTEFNNGSIIWTENDQIRACYYHTSGVWSKYYASTQNTVTDGGAKATFTNFTEFPAVSGEGTYTFYAGYPKNAIGGSNTYAPTAGELSVELLTEQTMPNLGTFDANADIMVGVSPEVVDAPATTVSAMWTRLVAHGCVTLKNLAAETGEIVKTVTFTAPEGVNLTGTGKVNFTEQTMTALNNNTVTVALPTGTEAKVAELPVWFCSAPATIAAGANFTVAVETTRGTYTRTITAKSNGINFMQNRYNTLGVDMATAEFVAAEVSGVVFQQITSVAELTTGEYVMAAKYNGTFYAIKSPFVLSSGKIASTAMSTMTVVEGQVAEADAAGHVFTLTANGNSVSVFDGANYIVYDSGTNFKLQTASANWTVVYDKDMFQFAMTRYFLFNWNSGNYRFGGYATSNWGGTDYSGLYLFKKVSNDPDAPVAPAEPSLSLAETSIEIEAKGGQTTVGVNAANLTAALTATTDDEWITNVSVSDTALTFTAEENDDTEERTAEIVVASGDLSVTLKITQKGVVTSTDVEKITVAQFIAKADTETFYELTGVVSNVANTTYGNFDLTDETGTILVYGLNSPDGTQNKYWDASGVKAGDIITIHGVYKLYNTTHEVDQARYISHVTSPKIVPAEASVSVAAEGGSKSVALTVENITETITVTENADWITNAVVNNNTLTFTVAENTTTDTRSADITLTAGSISATVTVQQAGQQATGSEVTANFITDNKFSMVGSGTTATLNASDGVVSIVIDKNTSTSNVALYTPLRFYQNHKMTFTSTKKITKIVFNYDSGKTPAELNIAKGAGSFAFSSPVGTYTCSGETEIAFTAPSQVRFSSIEVTYLN